MAHRGCGKPLSKIASVLTTVLMIASSAWAAGKAHNGYVQTNLVSDVAMTAATTDANLLNAWGLAFLPGAPFWINDNGAGVATLYDGMGNIVPLVGEAWHKSTRRRWH
jgi:hypothetical protein